MRCSKVETGNGSMCFIGIPKQMMWKLVGLNGELFGCFLGGIYTSTGKKPGFENIYLDVSHVSHVSCIPIIHFLRSKLTQAVLRLSQAGETVSLTCGDKNYRGDFFC